MASKIRLGFVGAGNNTRRKHLPGFQQLPDVELVAVCNSTEESSRRVAREFGIPNTFATWQHLVADDSIDAVVIGTWPHLHCDITCAALAAGKHVLTEARMARNFAEAQRMQEASQKFADRVAMVVPSPFGLLHDEYLRSIIDHGFLGELREVVVLGANDLFWDASQFLHPRQMQEKSGLNVLALGILHETVSRWIPPTTRVFAQSRLFEPKRPVLDEPELGEATVPDSLQVLTQIQGGAQGMYHLSGVTLFGPGLQIHLYGSEGTIKVQFDPQRDTNEQVYTGRHGDANMRPLKLPEDRLGAWRVEADFIAAIRGEKPVELNDFDTACQYMEFTQAVHESCERNAPVALPL